MRIAALLAGAVTLAFASAASATEVSLSPISYSPQFQTALTDNYGPSEGEFLQRDLRQAVERALARRGVSVAQGAPISIELSILDAKPNSPTLHQASHRLGLDVMRSISVGGAALQAVLRDGSGNVISTVSHRRFNNSLEEVFGPVSTWDEAERAIGQFADKVADAYVTHAGASN